MQPSSEEALHIKSNDSSTDIGASNATNQIKNTSVASEGIDELRSRLQEVQTLLEDMTVEKDRLLRENRRLSNAVKNAEDRVRSSLQVYGLHGEDITLESLMDLMFRIKCY